MFGLGHWEILILIIVVLLVFGAGRLPQVGSSLGKGIRNFRKSLKEDPPEEANATDKKQLEDKKDAED